MSAQPSVFDAPVNTEMPHLSASKKQARGKPGPSYEPENVAAAFAADINAGGASRSQAPQASAIAVGGPAVADAPAAVAGDVQDDRGNASGLETELFGGSVSDHVAGGYGNVIDRFGQNPVSASGDLGGVVPTERSARFPGLVSNRAASGRADAPSVPEGLYAKVPGGNFSRRGRVLTNTDEDLFPFNYTAGRRSEISFSVDRDDRMPAAEAKGKLRDILEMFGIVAEPHDFLYSFTHALLVSHALNGASVAGPGRAMFHVDGNPFSYGEVLKCLGQNTRRFFRAYADETAKALALVLRDYDPADAVSVYLCGQIRYIAVNRMLTQYPYLIHDSADACVRITNTEMAAVQRSKNVVLKDNVNSIEAMEKSAKE